MMSTQISEDHIWNILKSHNETVGMVEHQLTSFDNFITHGIDEILKCNDITTPNRTIKFSNTHIPKPTVTEDNRTTHPLTPCESRTRDLNYESPVYVTVTDVKTEDGIEKTNITHRVELCTLPIMLGCSKCHLHNKTKKKKVSMGECEYDDFGYFILRGNERVIVSQIRSAYNKALVFEAQSDKHKYSCELRSMSENTGHSVMLRMMICNNNRTIEMTLPYVKENIPVYIVFKALGFNTFEEINELIGIESEEVSKYIKFMIRDGYIGDTDKSSTDSACEYIGERSNNQIKITDREKYGKQIVEIEMLPHIGIKASRKTRAAFIGYMLNKLLSTTLGLRKVDDIDDYSHKRVENTGILCKELFSQLFKKFRESFINTIEKKKQQSVDIMTLISRNNTITTGFRHCFSTGSWGVPKTSYVRAGVSQILSRLSYGATLSHKRRLSIPIGKEAKNTKIRQINPSQIMFVCPAETPEGQPVGIVLNLTMLTRISERFPTYIIIDIVEKCKGFCKIDVYEKDNTKVFVNGILVGTVEDAYDITSQLRKSRSDKAINYDVSISYNDIDDEVNIWCDAGRLVRPVFTIEGSSMKIRESDGVDWSTLVDKSLITYMDSTEINNMVIAFNQNELGNYKADFCEIHPSMILGVMGSIIPWPDHSQSPRNCYQTSMGKQAMSMYALSYKQRTDTVSHILGYPQRPLVGTRQGDLMGFNEMPSGINAIVAIACYSGFNQEDSLIINQSALDRGLFTAISYKTHTDQAKKIGMSCSERIGCPPLDKRKMDINYGLLGPDGIVMERFGNGKAVYVEKGDVIVGKYFIETDKQGVENINDCSLVIKKGEEGYVDKIIKTKTPDGNTMVKVTIRTERKPEVGDKFASRAAQKGTCGATYQQQDMPWTADGMCPDMIINPHCIPSRMTINQLMETVLGKSCALEGKFGDATPFGGSSVNIANDLCDRLGMNKYERTGKEVLYNGFTGESMGSYFIGPVYYQRLKHLVGEKIHARATGPVTTLTRQPLEGRSRDGGLRFGEMERDGMISHGTSMFLKDRLCDQSDPYKSPICNNCGSIAKTASKCGVCESDSVSMTNMPYVSKLVLQELNAMCIKTSIKVS